MTRDSRMRSSLGDAGPGKNWQALVVQTTVRVWGGGRGRAAWWCSRVCAALHGRLSRGSDCHCLCARRRPPAA